MANNKLTSSYKKEYYELEDFERVVDINISELYTEPISLDEKISNFFNTYEILDNEIQIPEKLPFHNDLLLLTRNLTQGTGVVYTDSSHTIDFNGVRILIENSSSLAQEKDDLKSELDDLKDRGNWVNNLDLKEWNEGRPISWSVNIEMGVAEVPSYEKRPVARFTRIESSENWSRAVTGGSYVPTYQKFRLTGQYRTKDTNNNYQISWDDPRTESGEPYYWAISKQLVGTDNMWTPFSQNFVTEEHPLEHNSKIRLKVYIKDEALVGDYVEMNNLKLEAVNTTVEDYFITYPHIGIVKNIFSNASQINITWDPVGEIDDDSVNLQWRIPAIENAEEWTNINSDPLTDVSFYTWVEMRDNILDKVAEQSGSLMTDSKICQIKIENSNNQELNDIASFRVRFTNPDYI